MVINVVIVKQDFLHCPGIAANAEVMAQNVLRLLRGAHFSLPHPSPNPPPLLIQRKNWQRSVTSGRIFRKSVYNNLPFPMGEDTWCFFSKRLREADPKKNSKFGGFQHPHFALTKRFNDHPYSEVWGGDRSAEDLMCSLGLEKWMWKRWWNWGKKWLRSCLRFHCIHSKDTRMSHGWMDTT